MKATRFYTNKPACGPKRGHGAVQPRFAIETTLDKIAEQLSLDPAEMRKRNAVEPNSFTVNGLRVTSCGIKECIDKVVKESGWKEKFGRLPAGRGIGLACSTYISGAGKSIHWFKNTEKKDLPHSGVMVKIDRGGGIAVFCGSSDIGQGSNTVLQMITAEVLGVEMNDVKVFEADTDLTPVDLGSYSSRVTFMAGNACIEACNKLKMKLLACARERLLNDSGKTMEILGGIAKVNFSIEDMDIEIAHREAYLKSDPKKSISFQELANWAELKYGTLADVGSYAPPQMGMDYKGSGAGPSPSYSFTAHVVELEGDHETGEVRIDKIWAAHDCGRAINPLLVEGQIEGSVYMGVGEALGEEYSFSRAKGNYNERLGTPPGLLRTPSLLEYKLPTSMDTPKIYAYIIETIDPEGPFGAKEAGEGPQLAAVPAIGNAIYNALKVRMNEVPFTPEKILMELEKGGKTQEKLKSSLQPTKGKKVIEI
jgi:CO/xanthine dehydrogenase Mo-binding subunit